MTETVKSQVSAHYTLAQMAAEAAHKLYEAYAKDNNWYRTKRRKMAKKMGVDIHVKDPILDRAVNEAVEKEFCQECAPTLIPFCRGVLAKELEKDSNSPKMKEQIFETLMADAALPLASERGGIFFSKH